MISIILPYDRNRGYLQRMRDSIEAQTYEDWELIEVHSPASVAKNFNTGLQQADGEFVKVVGEDDWLPHTSLMDLINGIGDHPWICANAYNVSNKVVYREEPDPSKLNLKDMAEQNVIHGGSTLYRTEILKEIGGMDETLWTGEEYDMNMHLMSKGYLPGYVNKFVYYYMQSTFQKSTVYRREDPAKRREAIEQIQKRYGNNRSRL